MGKRKKRRKRRKGKNILVEWAWLPILLLMVLFSVMWGQTFWANRKLLFTFRATEGVVIGKKLRIVYHPKTISDPGGVGYIPEISYRYTVDGQEYENNIYALAFLSFSFKAKEGKKGWAERALARYQIGDRIKVYYDPKDPRRSILSGEIFWTEYLTFFILVGFIPGFALFVLYLSFGRDRFATKIREGWNQLGHKI